MLAIEERLFEEFQNSLYTAPLLIPGGAIFGYFYSLVANLPAGQSAKAWAIWVVAEHSILSVGSAFGETRAKQLFIKAILFTTTTIMGIEQMRQRKLIGDGMVVAMLMIRGLIVLGLLTNAAISARRKP